MAKSGSGNFQFKFVNNFPKVRGEIQSQIKKRVTLATLHVNTKIKVKLASGNRSGKIYKVPGTLHKFYTSSAPGQAPAVMLSNLLNSISFMVALQSNVMIGTVGTNMDYAKRLEFGFIRTDKKGRRYNMAPRPFFGSTFEEEKAAILAILSRKM